MVGLPLYYLMSLKEFIEESLIIQKHVNLVLAQSRGKQSMTMMFVLNSNKEPHLESSSYQVVGFIPTTT
jgi:hypothetical protein